MFPQLTRGWRDSRPEGRPRGNRCCWREPRTYTGVASGCWRQAEAGLGAAVGVRDSRWLSVLLGHRIKTRETPRSSSPRGAQLEPKSAFQNVRSAAANTSFRATSLSRFPAILRFIRPVFHNVARATIQGMKDKHKDKACEIRHFILYPSSFTLQMWHVPHFSGPFCPPHSQRAICATGLLQNHFCAKVEFQSW